MVKKSIVYLMIICAMLLAIGPSVMAVTPETQSASKSRSVESYLKFDDAQTSKFNALKAETCTKMTNLKQTLVSENAKLKDLETKKADPKDIKAQQDVVEGMNQKMISLQNKYIEDLIGLMTPRQKRKFKKYKYVINEQGCVCGDKCDCSRGKPCAVAP